MTPPWPMKSSPNPLLTHKSRIESKERRRDRRAEKRLENAELSVLSGIGEPPAAQGSTGAPKRHPRRSKSLKSSRRKKSPTLAKLKKVLWKAISKLVRSWSPVCLACNQAPTEVAAHIVPSNEGAITRYFLPNLYPCCGNCNGLEKWNRATWVFHHRQVFGEEFVDALYAMADGEKKKKPEEKFQLKAWWVIEQTGRINRLLGVA